MEVPYWQAVAVKAGQTLLVGAADGAGLRAYLAVRGGLDVPDYLGSRATFTLGLFGGHAGRALRVGDVLRLRPAPVGKSGRPVKPELARLPAALIPTLGREWEIGVFYGPHGAPDFFTEEDIHDLFTATYEVHYNSARTGVRLIGPRPRWARQDGGEAGLHPSNIHDNAYAIGAVDFTGDMPIILGPDGPSLGGFVCPLTIVQSELWKIGQLKPADKVRFRPLTAVAARTAELAQDAAVESLRAPKARPAPAPKRQIAPEPAILHSVPERKGLPAISYRRAGDRYLLIEYGPLVLDLNLRFRVHALHQWLIAHRLPGLLDLTPGIRSLQVHYDPRILPLERLMETLREAEAALPGLAELEVPTRIVHLPLSWEDESTLLAIRKYMQIVRKDAPWCPSNLEFIRRINGLDSVDQVREIAFGASYLVLGLGDVYLGAPVATPVDPRHRLVTTKYNPARTWTPENAVESAGPISASTAWRARAATSSSAAPARCGTATGRRPSSPRASPGCCGFFDQIRFYPVSHGELLRFRDDFVQGKARLKIEHETFRLRAYNDFLALNRPSIEAFKGRQQAAFEAERGRWEASGQLNFSAGAEARRGAGERRGPAAGLHRRSGAYSRQRLEDQHGGRGGGPRRRSPDRHRVDEDGNHHRGAALRPRARGALRGGPPGECRRDAHRHGGRMNGDTSLGLAALRGLYARGRAHPQRAGRRDLAALRGPGRPGGLDHRLPREELLAHARRVEARGRDAQPLYGVPFALKDNIDLAGAPTTAGCPPFAYAPAESAAAVARLLEAGAIPIGKTNLDQFATGLVGTRSPYGVPRNPFHPEAIPGGSSSGSAVAVAAGLVAFALGTDTAGSGRVPASFNNLVGLKPTRGWLSTRGVVPACRSLDCVSIFALTVEDAESVAGGWRPALTRPIPMREKSPRRALAAGEAGFASESPLRSIWNGLATGIPPGFSPMPSPAWRRSGAGEWKSILPPFGRRHVCSMRGPGWPSVGWPSANFMRATRTRSCPSPGRSSSPRRKCRPPTASPPSISWKRCGGRPMPSGRGSTRSSCRRRPPCSPAPRSRPIRSG